MGLDARTPPISGAIWRASRSGPLDGVTNALSALVELGAAIGSILGSGVPASGGISMSPLQIRRPANSSIPKRRCAQEAKAVHPGKTCRMTTSPARISTPPCMDRRSTALCLSGGGIRSASFALGVIEALAVHPRRPAATTSRRPAKINRCSAQFNYLSTVSGGGYIGSWLSAWIARASFPEGLEDARRPPRPIRTKSRPRSRGCAPTATT